MSFSFRHIVAERRVYLPSTCLSACSKARSCRESARRSPPVRTGRRKAGTLRVSRPMLLEVLNCWVTDTNDTFCLSNNRMSWAKSASDLDKPVHLVDNHDVDFSGFDIL